MYSKLELWNDWMLYAMDLGYSFKDAHSEVNKFIDTYPETFKIDKEIYQFTQ